MYISAIVYLLIEMVCHLLEQYRLNQDKAITLMKWCNDHDIPYIYRSEDRGTYLQYDYDDLEGEIWQIPDME